LDSYIMGRPRAEARRLEIQAELHAPHTDHLLRLAPARARILDGFAAILLIGMYGTAHDRVVLAFLHDTEAVRVEQVTVSTVVAGVGRCWVV
jgi:hypothetical protein